MMLFVWLIFSDRNPDDDTTFMMFSATFPPQARKLARFHLAKDHVRVRVGRAGSTHENITQHVRYQGSSRHRLLTNAL